MVGAKSLLAIPLTLVIIVSTMLAGKFAPSYIVRLDPTVLFISGLISVFFGTLFCRFWQIKKGSATYFRFSKDATVSENEVVLLARQDKRVLIGNLAGYSDDRGLGNIAGHQPWELPIPIHRGCYIAAFFSLALLSFDNRTAELLYASTTKLDPSVSQFCPEKEDEEATFADDPGCKLIRRAFELGYTKDLGDCGPTKKSKAQSRVCTLRRRDEPFIHYSWRLLTDPNVKSGNELLDSELSEKDLGFVEKLTARFQLQWEHLPTLASLQWTAVSSRPRSSHHIWTNLPPPERGFFYRIAGFFKPRRCIDSSSAVSKNLGEPSWTATSSELLAHAISQMVYSPQYRPTIGYCPEYHVHWDSASNTCTKLSNDPESILDSSNALDSIAEVLTRRRNDAEVADLGRDLQKAGALRSRSDIARSRKSANHPTASPQSIVSFSCFFVVEDGKNIVTNRDFILSENSFTAREMRVNRDSSAPDLYKLLGQLLAPGFQYGGALPASAYASAPAKTTDLIDESQLMRPNYPLSQLEVLRDAEIFEGNLWLANRADLLMVFPYQEQLRRLVSSFRNRYRVRRGRL